MARMWRYPETIDQEFDLDLEVRFDENGFVVQESQLIEPHTMWMRKETPKRPITLPKLKCLEGPDDE